MADAIEHDEEYLEFLDTQPVDFGKHNGLTPEQICKDNPSYIVWMHDTIKPKRCSKKLYLIASEMNDQKKAPRKYSAFDDNDSDYYAPHHKWGE